MIQNLLKIIGSLIIAFGSLFGVQQSQAPLLGDAALPSQTPAVFETYLATQQSTSDTTLTLASGSLRDGKSLSGYACLTIDSNTASLEYECGTVSGTSMTAIQRGLDATTGTTTVASLIFAHRRGADVKVTDYPSLTILTNQMNGTQAIFASTGLLYESHPCVVGSATTTICDKNYIDAQVSAGAANADASTKGIVQMSTNAQAALGTALGSTGASLTLGANLATSTPYNSGFNQVPITGTNGKLSQLFLDLTQAFTWTGQHNFNATTSIAASSTTTAPLKLNGLAYSFPSTRGASSTVLQEDGQGDLSYEGLDYQLLNATTTGSLTTCVATSTVPSRNDYLVVIDSQGLQSGNNELGLVFNGDYGANYGSRNQEGYINSGGNSVGLSNQKQILLGANGTSTRSTFYVQITNTPSSVAKSVVFQGSLYPASGGAIAPTPVSGTGVWNNTAAQITSIAMESNTGSGCSNTQFSNNSVMRVYGSAK